MRSKSHRCPICEKSFPRPSKLKYHIAYHHEKKFSFECVQCGKPYSSQDHANRHFRLAHQQDPSRTNKFPCTMNSCSKTFANKQNLDRHIRIAHTQSETKVVKCLYCLEVVDSLELHLTTEHQSTSIDKLKCLDCSKEYSSVKRLVHHRIIHTDERREVDVQWTMKRLLDAVDRQEIFRCDLCNRIFRSLFQLDQHRHSQIHQSHFECQYADCGKTFLHMRNLRQHVKIHHEDRLRLKCPMQSCSKTFTCQASICRHLVKCHSSKEIIKQINLKPKSSDHVQQKNIQSLLSGFNSRTLRQDNEVARQMKSLLKFLLTEDNLVQIPNASEKMDSSEKSIDQNLLNGYKDIGLVRL